MRNTTPDDEIDVALTDEQWEFIVADAHESLSVYDELAQTAVGQSRQEMLDSAALCRATITVVTGALKPPPPP